MTISRSAGILMPISSLPSNYGIGTLGKEAYKFVDFLVKAKQSYWQVLPIGHTSYGDSPYQCFSSFAGNPYFIDLDILVKEKLLKKSDLKNIRVKCKTKIDYGYLYKNRYPLLYKAYKVGICKYSKEFDKFCKENNWIEDYSLFMAVKKHFNNVSWIIWPDKDIKERKKESIIKYKKLLYDDILFYKFIQFLFYKQYYELKKYANLKGIKIIGDLPIYVALDSSEVWADTKQFRINKTNKIPKVVAGVPPDYFNADGQLWGNPIYDWNFIKKDNYKWWINRLKGVSKCFDVVRIDHFIGFQRIWAIPFEDKTARNGKWLKGPSIDFINVMKDKFKNIDFIAEDLGFLNDACIKLLKDSGFPGMRVLEFSISDDGTCYHAPHNHIENCICYISTHDNLPIMGWKKQCSKKDLDFITKYYGLNNEEGFNWGLIRSGMNSVSKLFVCQIQDYLGLGEEATINHPGTLGNWTWRIKANQLTDSLANKIAYYTRISARENKCIKNNSK